MKSIILATLILAGLPGVSQTDTLKGFIVNDTSGVRQVRAPSSDSFDFCGLRFPTFRDCVEGSWRNCCSYYLDPAYVTCTDVGALSWEYMPSLDIAEMNIKNHLSDLEKHKKIISKDTIYCNVLGNRAKAYHVKRITDGLIWSDIRMGSIVNGQAIMLRLNFFKLVVTNQHIPPVFRQIVTLAD